MIFCYFAKRPWFNKFWSTTFNKHIHNNFFLDIFGYNAAYVRIVCYDDNVVYSGKITYFEENGIDSWLQLEEYSITDKNGEYKFSDIKEKSSIIINLRSVSRIEWYRNN